MFFILLTGFMRPLCSRDGALSSRLCCLCLCRPLSFVSAVTSNFSAVPLINSFTETRPILTELNWFNLLFNQTYLWLACSSSSHITRNACAMSLCTSNLYYISILLPTFSLNRKSHRKYIDITLCIIKIAISIARENYICILN